MLLSKTSGGTQVMRDLAPAALLLTTFGTARRATGARAARAQHSH
jgi:hypothetical protein